MDISLPINYRPSANTSTAVNFQKPTWGKKVTQWYEDLTSYQGHWGKYEKVWGLFQKKAKPVASILAPKSWKTIAKNTFISGFSRTTNSVFLLSNAALKWAKMKKTDSTYQRTMSRFYLSWSVVGTAEWTAILLGYGGAATVLGTIGRYMGIVESTQKCTVATELSNVTPKKLVQYACSQWEQQLHFIQVEGDLLEEKEDFLAIFKKIHEGFENNGSLSLENFQELARGYGAFYNILAAKRLISKNLNIEFLAKNGEIYSEIDRRINISIKKP